MLDKYDSGIGLEILWIGAFGQSDPIKAIGKKVLIHGEYFSAITTIEGVAGTIGVHEKERLVLAIVPLVVPLVLSLKEKASFLQIAEIERRIGQEITDPTIRVAHDYELRRLLYESSRDQWYAEGILSPLPELLENSARAIGRKQLEAIQQLPPGMPDLLPLTLRTEVVVRLDM